MADRRSKNLKPISAMYQFGHGVEENTELSLFWGMRGRAVRGDEAAAKWLKERK